jgi:hypothetical protein
VGSPMFLPVGSLVQRNGEGPSIPVPRSVLVFDLF